MLIYGIKFYGIQVIKKKLIIQVYYQASWLFHDNMNTTIFPEITPWKSIASMFVLMLHQLIYEFSPELHDIYFNNRLIFYKSNSSFWNVNIFWFIHSSVTVNLGKEPDCYISRLSEVYCFSAPK